MKIRNSLILISLFVLISLLSLACLSMGGTAPEPTTVVLPPTSAVLRQWASVVSASSEYGSSDWSASQAAGAPNTSSCGDNVTAWASASFDTQEWLDVGFATPVVPTQVNIHETYNPGSIIRVELRDAEGAFHTVWEAVPSPIAECPRVLSINVTGIDFKVNAVLISLDQGVMGSWDEIDAVELVGTP